MADSAMSFRSCRELWIILLGRSALREPAQIESELETHWDRLNQGLSYYKPPSASSAGKVKEKKDVAQPLKDFGLRLSKLLGLDELQSVQLLQCYLQEDYRGTRDSLKIVLKDERQSQALLLKVADYYYEERMCLLRCVLLLLTYFQDDRHPYRAEYSNCVNKLEKDLVSNYQQQFQSLFRAEAPTWETHGNLMTERQVSRWYLQCLREQSLLLEIVFLYYAYFEMTPADLLAFTKMFKEQGFGLRQTNRHLVDRSMDVLVDRIGYLSALILVEGMDVDFLHKCALEDCTEQHQFSCVPDIVKEMDQLLLTFGDIPHHGPVLVAWVLLRHTLRPDESNPVVRRIGSAALQLEVFKYLAAMLKGLGVTGNNCTASTAKMCVYGLLSFVITSFEEESLQTGSAGSQSPHLIDVACEVLSAPSLAEVFWEMKPDMGLGMILDGAVGMFPYKMAPLLQLLTALVSNKSTAKRVYNFLDKMSFYTQAYKHKPNDIIAKEDETLWRRQTPKLLYPLGTGQTNLWMPQGILGQVVLGGEPGYVVRWDYSYSSWTLFTCEVEMLLHAVSTADVMAQCARVKPVLDLVHKIISTDWTLSDCLLPLTSRIYMLLQRLTSVINPPLDVIASCVNCLSVLAARMPSKVWSSLQRTGFLPYTSNPVNNLAQCLSAEGMKAGNYGNLLVQMEQPRGEYAVTTAFLKLVTTLVKGQLGSTQNKGLIPCVLLVLKEMLPTYHKWRYNTYGVRERIGCLILELIHAILNLSPECDDHQSSIPTLQSLCIYSLANSEAGQAVVNIMGVGVDKIDMVLAAQPSSCGSEGPGQVLTQMIKLALSVTNNAIRLKGPSDTASPLERALTQHGGHGANLVAVLAKYIYHKHDPALPRLAIQLLKRLASVAPMSVYACLGSDAPAIRDAFLTRLQSKTEDMRIKVMILEFLTVAVETQPGLIELFLNLEAKDCNEGSKEFLVGEWSCLHGVLELIDSKQQGKYWCPPLLHRAAVAFLLALWQDRRDSAISVLRTQEKFWENLTTPLFGALAPPSDITEPCVLETCAFVMKIVGLEIFYVHGGSPEPSLQDALRRFGNARRYEYWSQYVKSLACHVAEMEDEGVTYFPQQTHLLILAWRMLLVLATAHSDVMQLTDNQTKLKLFMDALDATKAALTRSGSVPCLRLGSTTATLLLVLLKQWRSVVAGAPDILSPLSLMLESVLQADPQMIERTKAKLLSALISALQIQGLDSGEVSQLPQLLAAVCETAKDQALALMNSTRHTRRAVEPTEEDDESMETDFPLGPQKDERDGVSVLALHLAKELCLTDEDGEHWGAVMRKIPVLPSVLGAVELSLRSKQNLYFTEAALHLLLTLARSPQGAAAVAGTGIIQTICLPLLSVYEMSGNGASQSLSRKAQDGACWPGVYRLCLSLMESLLKTLRYHFLHEALDFAGVHRERILQCLNAVSAAQSLACLEEADHTVGFLLQLSSFSAEWRFHLPDLHRDVQVNLCYLCQTCTYLLHSKKMLHHYLQAKNGESLPAGPSGKSQHAPTTPSKESATGGGESDDAERKVALSVQCGLLKILSKTLASLRHFTPDCCQIILDERMDLSSYQTLFALSFTAPAFDPDASPSFGTLLATVNVALGTLAEMEKKKDAASLGVVALASSEEIQALKSLLMFTMENCFYILVSQALRCLKDNAIPPRDKQRLKQELCSELSTLLSSLSRHFRRGSPASPAQAKPPTPGSKGTHEGQEPIIQLAQAFVRLLQR
ncbi:nucleoporin NUP188 [Corythoichthys intestinalis]|uniref:nucleoporin NUP188 n=1 Tax=Corythoichthys intestinalis TaxID=161448 RepID=UPI0025A5489C|nr:nucleoporin NUP188 [Corythoichthys intestinalis]XP_061800808.1 nucleoporin NUP188-like [Nerophis lumbriciformis]